MVFFQLGAVVAKGLFANAGVEGTTALRVGLGALMLAVVLRPWRAAIRSWRSGLAVLGYGVALGLMNLAFYNALAFIPLGAAVALEFVGPLAVALAGWRRTLDVVWAALAAAGIALLSPLGAPAHGLDPHGVALALGAGPAGRPISCSVRRPAPIMALPYSLEMVALTRLPARVYGTLTSLDPVLAALVGLVMLHESLAARQWLALGLIVAASTGAATTIRRPPPALHN